MKVYTIEQLEQLLSNYPKNTLVFMSSDEEGNSTHPLSTGIADIWYDPKKETFHEGNAKKGCKRGIIIYPQHIDVEYDWEED